MGAGHRITASSIMFSALLLGAPGAGAAKPATDAAGQPAVTAGAAAPDATRPDFSELDAQVAQWVSDGLYPGAGLIIGKGHERLFERYYGTYDAKSKVHVASAGKWLAAATIAALVDRGKLHWDDRVSRFIPQMPAPMADATLRQLLSHTSGFADYQPADRPRDHYQTLEESVKHILPLPADAEPGAKFRYGGLAMQVAGRMAEVASGESWEALFQRLIAQPLGMQDSGFTPVPDEEGFSPTLGGSAFTTLRDYARFLEMVSADGRYDGRRVLSVAAIEEMQRDQVGRARLADGEYVEQARALTHHGVYGLGEWRERLDQAGRAVQLSSPGWAGAYPWIDKQSGTYGFLLAKVDVGRAKALGVSSFLSSPVMASMAHQAMKDASTTGVRRGYASVRGGRLYWEEHGKGPPLILIHGHSFDRTMWDPQMAALSKDFTVIRYDMRGYGRSTMPRDRDGQMHAADLVELMDALGIPKAHLVGLSLGGAVGLDMAILHPDRVLSLTAASGDIFDFYPGPDEPWTAAAIAQREKEIAALRRGGIQAFKEHWLDQLTTRGGGCVDAIRPKVWDMLSRWTAWQPLHLEPRLLLGRAASERLRRRPLTMPVQILTGDADLERPDPLLAIAPGTSRVVVPNAGHVMNLENPAAFNAAVIAFAQSRRPIAQAMLAPLVSACPSPSD
ncbi:alpha/beta fold hydrolase [Novosphingobium sp. BL-52-GroH]|uniref:alpha/beta fold hydrolase n=1 Tax=Novosphingobium sp. BL-52-GroH TaxID=3349877 RepID=UPI00384D67C1